MNWQDEQKKVATGVTGYVAQMQEGKDFTLTTPQPKREWVGLTDEEIVECWARPTMWATAHAIEAKLKEKNLCNS